MLPRSPLVLPAKPLCNAKGMPFQVRWGAQATLKVRMLTLNASKQPLGWHADVVTQRVQKHLLAADCLPTTRYTAAQDNKQISSKPGNMEERLLLLLRKKPSHQEQLQQNTQCW